MPGAWFESCFVSTDIWADCDGSDHQPMRAELVLPGPLPRGGAPPPPELRNNLILAGATTGRSPCSCLTTRMHPHHRVSGPSSYIFLAISQRHQAGAVAVFKGDFKQYGAV